MNSYIAKFACIPYLSPPPPNPNIKTTDLHPEDTLMTLFDGFEYSFINDRNEKIRMFQDLEINLPKVCNLQSDRLPNGAEPNKINETVMTFLMNLADNSIHLFSLCPIPKLDTLKLDFLIRHCLNRRIPIERSIWAIQHYIKKMDTSVETMTNTLISIDPPDIIFYCKLCNGIYRNNLINHIAFLKWAITHIHPDNLSDFEKDFVRTHSLLYYALSSTNVSGNSNFPIFMQSLVKSLLINQSHLIQLALLCENQKIFSLSQSQCIYNLIFNPTLQKRVRRIHKLLFSNEFKRDCTSSLQYLIPVIIFKDFPHYNFEVILNLTRSATFFTSPTKQTKIALNICKAVINRFNDTKNVAPLIAWLLRKLHFRLDMTTFCEWIYEFFEPTFSLKNDRSINTNFNSLKVLFYELQFQGILNYKEFHFCIHSHGYFSTRKNATKRIISELPILLHDLANRCEGEKSSRGRKSRRVQNIRSANEIFPKVLLDLRLLFPENQIESKLRSINADVAGNVEVIKTLPFVARFVVAVWLIVANERSQKRLDSKSLFNFLNEIGAQFLIPEISRNSSFVPPNAADFLAAYESHGLRNKIEKYLTAEISPSRPIDKNKISDFFNRHSHICSLHVLDLSFSVRNHSELCTLLSLFFSDLLTFTNMSYSSFFSFFDEFLFLMLVPDPLALFLSLFLSSCYLKKNVYKDSEKVSFNSILNDADNNDQNQQNFVNVLTFAAHFVRDLFGRRVLKPSKYVTIVLDIARSQSESPARESEVPLLLESLVQTLLDYISEKPKFFDANDCLTSDVVDSFNELLVVYKDTQKVKETVETVYHNFLTQLKILRPPQFSSVHSYTPSFLCALYTLLPAELFSDDCGSIIDFFKRNSNAENTHFWSSWLRDRTDFKPGFPVVVHDPFPESKQLKYITELVDTFWNERTTQRMTQSNSAYEFFDESPEKDQIVECWWVLCASKSISNAVVQKCINKSFFNFDCLHPALLAADELILECLCDTLRETNTTAINDNFVASAVSVFVIFVAKFAKNYKYFSLIVSVANKMLEWMVKLNEEESEMLMTVIDGFNFIVCWSFDHENDQENLNEKQSSAIQNDFKPFANQVSIQDMLHSKIVPNLNKLPREVKRKIILNRPRQIFKTIKNPFFSDFVSQDNEGGSQFQIHSTFNEGGGNYHGDFGFFDDDVVDQLFWG